MILDVEQIKDVAIKEQSRTLKYAPHCSLANRNCIWPLNLAEEENSAGMSSTQELPTEAAKSGVWSHSQLAVAANPTSFANIVLNQAMRVEEHLASQFAKENTSPNATMINRWI